MINSQLFRFIERDSLLFHSDIHGLNHWKAVEKNGLYLAKFTSADTKVVSYFAYLHDCMRENESEDEYHGPRGAAYALKHKNLLGLTETQLKTLILACKDHTHCYNSNCPTINTCWDADRLDIGRVGISPNSKYMFIEEAKRIADEKDFKVLGRAIS